MMVEPALQTNVRMLMGARPETVVAFLRDRMPCPGCAMSPAVTIGEVAASGGADAEAILAGLRAARIPEGAAP